MPPRKTREAVEAVVRGPAASMRRWELPVDDLLWSSPTLQWGGRRLLPRMKPPSTQVPRFEETPAARVLSGGGTVNCRRVYSLRRPFRAPQDVSSASHSSS